MAAKDMNQGPHRLLLELLAGFGIPAGGEAVDKKIETHDRCDRSSSPRHFHRVRNLAHLHFSLGSMTPRLFADQTFGISEKDAEICL